jgi:hypothetical protein
VHRDVYRRAAPAAERFDALVAEHGLGSRIDRARAAEVIARAEGLAREIGPAATAPREAAPAPRSGVQP